MKPLRLIHFILNLIYPNVCGICNKQDKEDLCEKCEIKFKKIAKIKIHEVQDKNFKKHLYLFKYEGLIKQKLIDYKFNEKPYIYKSFVKFMINNKKVCAFLKSYDIIIPVPIHKHRNRERGYNQSTLIAEGLAKQISTLNCVEDVLYKTRNIAPQSGKTKAERIRDVVGTYEIKNKEKIMGRKVLLLDDIYTTGSTVNECCKVLKMANPCRLDVLTLAKD